MTVALRTPSRYVVAEQSGAKPAGKPAFLEFFAGSGLVSHALAPFFRLAWANDISPEKALVFKTNHYAAPFQLDSIADVNGADLPRAFLSWGSFPCQDLSLAGRAEGIRAERSGLVWEWLRVMDEMPSPPPLVVAENVVGLVSSASGKHYRELHNELAQRGYRVGAMVLDAARWTPQSRPRVFVVGVSSDIKIPPELLDIWPNWLHTPAIVKASVGLRDWLWWRMPTPPPHRQRLSNIIEWDAPCFDAEKNQKTLALIAPSHMVRLEASGLSAAPGYKRTRNGKQVMELRFDDMAGCLRTPSGGSSRQFLILKNGAGWKSRLLTVRETARLMGAPDSFRLPGGYNDGYKAMGDAVAAPVAAYLAQHLLSRLAVAHGET
jgi:DNA (cytosine-5)-methyltransferase 1